MNPLDDTHRERLSKALTRSYESLGAFRRPRRQLIEDYVGPRYAADGFYKKPETYVNLLQLAADAKLKALAYNEPRLLVTAKTSEQRAFAARFQLAINNYAQKIHLGDTIRAIILDAVFMVGIGKIHLADSAEVYHENDIWMDPGMPHVSRVSFDNWVHDTTKSDFRFAQFFGDRFSMDLEAAQSCEYFNQSVREDLQATRRGERDYSEMAGGITQEDTTSETELEDVVDLLNIYLPKERVVCTWPAYGKFELASTPPLAVLDWDGPETGPYRFLSFMDVPDNIMPTSPAQALCPLFYLYNFLMRKIARRSKQQKDVICYDPGGAEDIGRALMADDLQSIKVTHTKAIDLMRIPGPDQGLVAFTYGLSEIFNQSAGNPKTASGVAPSAQTLGQEQLLNQNASAMIAEDRRRVDRFVSEVANDVGWLLFDDPMQSIPGQQQVSGTDYSVDASWHPPDVLPRHGTFADYDIKIEAGSMEYRSPEARLGQIVQGLQVLMPLMPLAQQQGLEFQFDVLLEDFADLTNEPRFKNYFRSAPPPPNAEQPAMGAMRPPGTGQYTRTNVSERTPDGALTQMMQQQPQEQPAGMMG